MYGLSIFVIIICLCPLISQICMYVCLCIYMCVYKVMNRCVYDLVHTKCPLFNMYLILIHIFRLMNNMCLHMFIHTATPTCQVQHKNYGNTIVMSRNVCDLEKSPPPSTIFCMIFQCINSLVFNVRFGGLFTFSPCSVLS